jgi:hypothetical protein
MQQVGNTHSRQGALAHRRAAMGDFTQDDGKVRRVAASSLLLLAPLPSIGRSPVPTILS